LINTEYTLIIHSIYIGIRGIKEGSVMKLLKRLFMDTCPTCKKVLETKQSNFLKAIVIKTCPDNHYQKEFHPALESYIESNLH
jgi:hypothetical protein